MIPKAGFGDHGQVLWKLTHLSNKISAAAVAVPLLQRSIDDRNASCPEELRSPIITQRDIDKALAQAPSDAMHPSIPHQGHHKDTPASPDDSDNSAGKRAPAPTKIRRMAAAKKRPLSEESGTLSPRKRLRPNTKPSVDGDSTS
jgi:hypothetical protein